MNIRPFVWEYLLAHVVSDDLIAADSRHLCLQIMHDAFGYLDHHLLAMTKRYQMNVCIGSIENNSQQLAAIDLTAIQ